MKRNMVAPHLGFRHDRPMRTALALLALLPTAALAQQPSPAGVAYRECVETAAIRYAHVAGSISEAVNIAFISCIKERDIYLRIHPANDGWTETVKMMRDRLLVMVAEERLTIAR